MIFLQSPIRGGRGDKGSRAREEEKGELPATIVLLRIVFRAGVLAGLLAHSTYRNRGGP